MAEDNTQSGGATDYSVATGANAANTGDVDLRAEKPVFDEKGESTSVTKDRKIEVQGGKVIQKAKEVHANKAEVITDPIQRMKEGVSKTMPKVKKTVFDNLKSIFVTNAKKTGSTVAKVDKSEAVGQKVTTAERQKYIDAEKLYNDGLASIKDMIAPSSMEIEFDHVRIDGMYARTFYVYAYPRFLNTNWLAPVINFDVTLDISQFIYPINSGEIMKTLKKKVAQMQSSMSIMSEKGQVSDPALETALQDAESLRREIQKGNEKFFQFALYFTVYAQDKKKLEKVSKQLESLLAGKLVLTKRAQVQAEHGFNSTIPQCLDELDTVRNMNTSPLSTTFPFTSSDLTSDDGILYGINRHNDSLVIFDRFELENANSVVFAKSGAGKSYAVKLEILRMMMLGTDVIVIDPENEYEALSQTVGGTYLKLSLNSDRRINPFDLPKPLEGEEVLPGDLVRSAVINLHGLMKLMLGQMSPEEGSLMDKALLDVYALKGITMEVTDPSTFEPPTMEDLHNILSNMEGADSLAKRLSKFTTGSFSGIFNKPTNVDLSGGLMVFCIRDLEDELRPIAMYIILNYIWNKVRSELKKRILAIDEAWTMMQHEDSARFLYGLVKRARKYYLGVTTITQDVEDFVKSPHGKPIITNSSMQLLLRQAPAAIDVLAKMFNLTEGERYVLLNSGVGQGLFFAGNKHVAIQIIASYIEDKIVTTNPEEILKARSSDVDFKTEDEKEAPEIKEEDASDIVDES
jgi:conjugal transfer ATP-binding protein TraC